MTATNTTPCSDYLTVDCSYGDGISVTPPTPPNTQREMNPTLHTPTSDYGSPSDSFYSPCSSDRSTESLPPTHYSPELLEAHFHTQTGYSPTLQRQNMWNGTNDATLSYRPQLPSIEWNHPQSLPVANRSGNINDYSPLSPVMPHLSLLSTGVTDHHPHFFAGNAPSNGQAEVTQGSLLLGSATPSSPPLVFNAYGSYLTRGSSTSRPDISASTPSGTGLLLVPVSRRHSLNAQRPVGGFFLESEATTPDTPSPSSPFSSFSSSTSASEGSSPAGPPVHLHVGSPANVAASTGRRKKPAKFGCMYCPATFTACHNLRNHLNAHAGVRPHLCPLCQYSFTTMAVMKRHQRKCKALPNVGPSFQPLHHQE